MHLYSADPDDLPRCRKRYGLDSLDLSFERHGRRFDGKCLMFIPLPDYAIASIRIGQYIHGASPTLQAEFHHPDYMLNWIQRVEKIVRSGAPGATCLATEGNSASTT